MMKTIVIMRIIIIVITVPLEQPHQSSSRSRRHSAEALQKGEVVVVAGASASAVTSSQITAATKLIQRSMLQLLAAVVSATGTNYYCNYRFGWKSTLPGTIEVCNLSGPIGRSGKITITWWSGAWNQMQSAEAWPIGCGRSPWPSSRRRSPNPGPDCSSFTGSDRRRCRNSSCLRQRQQKQIVIIIILFWIGGYHLGCCRGTINLTKKKRIW